MKANDEARRPTLRDALFSPVDAGAVIFFRVTFGLLMAYEQLHYVLGPRMESRYLTPHFLFKYPGFEWVGPGSETLLRLHFWGLFVCAILIALGLGYRIACVGFFFGYVYYFLLDQASYNNHYYLVCLISFVMIFIPANRSGSVDAWLRSSRGSSQVPAWALWMLRFHVALPYFFGGLAKLNYDWLGRAQPMRLWLTTGGVEEEFRFEILQEPWTAYFFSWGGLVFDLLVVPLLLYPRTRMFAYLAAVAFHLNNVFMFSIGFFPWLMICATTVFFSPDWPRRVGLVRSKPAAPKKAKKKRSAKKAAQAPGGRFERPSEGVQKLAVALFALYFAVHCFLPFRHLLYPGYVDWTEEGHRFAWRMKLRDKRGELRFYLIDPATRKAQELQDYESILTRRQLRKMTHDPEMMRQFARFLADRFRREKGREIEIRAYTSLSLNGRAPQPLIDPNFDLASTSSSVFESADWIVPLRE